MLFFVFHTDRPDAGDLRARTREAHLEYLGGFDVRVGGPTLSDDGETMNGTVLILDAPDRAAADAFVAGDPYVQAGVFDQTVVRPWRQVVLRGE